MQVNENEVPAEWEGLITDIGDAYKVVTSLAGELVTLLTHEDSETQFIGFGIPPVSVPDEGDVLLKGRSDFSVSTLDNWTHKEIVLSSYQQFKRQNGHSTRFSMRMPGVVVPHARTAETVNGICEALKVAKENVAQLVRTVEKTKQRHEIIHMAIPDVITYQLYRNIPVVHQNVSAVYFRWKTKFVAPIMDKTATVKMLEGTKAAAKNVIDREAHAEFMDEIITAVKNGPFNRFRKPKVHNSVPVHEYRLTNDDGTFSKKGPTDAGLPLLLLGQKGNKMPTVRPLKDFVRPNTSNEARSAINKKDHQRVHPNYDLLAID